MHHLHLFKINIIYKTYVGWKSSHAIYKLIPVYHRVICRDNDLRVGFFRSSRVKKASPYKLVSFLSAYRISAYRNNLTLNNRIKRYSLTTHGSWTSPTGFLSLPRTRSVKTCRCTVTNYYGKICWSSVFSHISTISQNNATPTVTLPGSSHRRRRGHWSEVSVHADIGKVIPQPANSNTRNKLAIVEFNTLQCVTRSQMF